jgi:hypothetical protein
VGKYSWSSRTTTANVAALVQPIDPQHSDPSPDLRWPDGQTPTWVSSVYAPSLPPEYTGEGFATPVAAGGGPIDFTPISHDIGGGGVEHGQDTMEALDRRGELHSIDYGATEARRYIAFKDREPGTGPQHAFRENSAGHGDSPQTLELQQTGVDRPNDPYARLGTRWLSRWWERPIDMHWWNVEFRPLLPKQAYTAPEQAPTPDGNQYDSPYVANGPFEATPDRFVVPQERRQPVSWSQNLTEDGSERFELVSASVWSSGL